MSVAASKPVAPAAPVPAPLALPKVRMTMHLLVSKSGAGEARVSVTEQAKTVLLELDADNSKVGVKAVMLSLPEAAELADMLNRIRRKVAERKAHRP
jgi:hypothetical protein